VLYDAKRSRVRGVRVIDANTMHEVEYTGRLVFLCASAIESVRLLLNSTSARFPNGLGNSSGLLGRYVMDHHYGSGASGTVPGFTDKKTFGRRPNGIYIARFRNVIKQHPDFLRGYGMQGGSGRSGWGRGGNAPGYGSSFKDSLIHDLGAWSLSASGWGETLPHEDNRVTLDPTVKDKWGIPAARIDVRWRDNERAMDKDMSVAMAEMLDAAGCTDIRQHGSDNPPGHCIHEMGGARMSKSPTEGVVNKWNQAWEASKLFMTDGACMASTACQNPSITYMALTARAVSHAVDSMKAGAL
jgi:choline dehydrogenase-like flavoprotein